MFDFKSVFFSSKTLILTIQLENETKNKIEKMCQTQVYVSLNCSCKWIKT